MRSTLHITQIDEMGISDLSLDVSRLPPSWVQEQRREKGRAGAEHYVRLTQGNAVKVVLLPADDPVLDEPKEKR